MASANFNLDRFIHLVEERPDVWKVNSKLNRNNAEKQKMWEEIALQFSDPTVTAAFCCYTWKNLYDTWVKEDTYWSDMGGTIKKKWCFYERLSFLHLCDSDSGRTNSNMSEIKIVDEELNDSSQLTSSANDNLSENSEPPWVPIEVEEEFRMPSAPNKSARRTEQLTQNAQLEAMKLEILSLITKTEDPDLLFIKSFGKQLSEMENAQKSKVKLAISKIFYLAAMKDFENDIFKA